MPSKRRAPSRPAPAKWRKTSTVAAKSFQLFSPGLMGREDFRAATTFCCTRESSLFQGSVGARSKACARNAASTGGGEPREKFRKSADSGSVAESIAERAEAGALGALWRPVGPNFEPGREATKEPAEGFEVGDGSAVGAPRRGLNGHGGLEASLGEGAEHAVGQFLSERTHAARSCARVEVREP